MKALFRKRLASIPRIPRAEEGLRAVVERAPQAEALAATWIIRVRPLASRLYNLRHRIATVAVAGLAAMLLIHVMFGDNGMVIYKQKRAEYEALRKQIAQEQRDNDRFAQQIQSLKSDQQAIEKEAREQMGYARPGEYVYVAPTPVRAAVPINHFAKK